MRSALSWGDTEKKVDDGNPYFACTPFSVEWQGLCGSWCQF
jgi:hypothetical protein